MSDILKIKALRADGTLRDITISVSKKAPWKIELVGENDAPCFFESRDLFEALCDMREEFEREGCQLLCAGARIDVRPSGMSRSMGGGRKAYVLRSGIPAADLVDIFDYAEPEAVGTVREQQEYFEAWQEKLRSPG